ncbi:hypothetical protein PAXINDRAFT_18677 [Paxillus involutus ATCC 200175]|uniref:Unplaced genomic scaffold PAXINscaffold_364, whole genome shotgun sequence n=1 Tax=Paxillus involutus ATCC 200175 TaxID=664439 RepID=A0A0C9TAW3_PAXIN|nr:hypothetical protein PAXINDRAFT_18677 [Paxillus involutus ATCC 200175]
MFPCREFKPYLRPGHGKRVFPQQWSAGELRNLAEHIREFDAKVIAYCDLYVITSPNADWIPEPHCFQIEELRVRADGHFGYQDCFQWPQAYSEKFEYAVCIPNPQKMREQEDPTKTLWELWTPTEDDFELIDPQSPFRVGKLKRSIYYNLYRLYDSAQDVVDQWKAKREGKKDIVTGMVLHSRHLLNVLKHHPLTFPDVVVYVAELQRFLFDTLAHMLYINDHQFTLTYPDFPRRTNNALMGCFTESISTCERLFHAGIPVWLVRSPQFIPQDMNIINVVTVTHPDHIVQKNFVHDGVVTMYPTLHLGRGGTDRHFNSRRTFRAKVLDAPDATSSVVVPQQRPVASSSQTASGGRVQANKNNNTWTTKSAWEKLVAKSLFGNALVHLQGNTWATQGDVSWQNQRITIATLEDPPAHLIRCILWEIYELGFRYELLDLDRAMVPGLWTEAPTERTELLYSIFPGESGLVMWQEDMPTTEQGMWASPATAYPFLESWRKLLSAWPEAPSRLCSPIVQESFSSVVQSEILSSACMFYVQTFFDLFGRPPIVTHRVPM